jgi:hypothetical protein
MRRVVIRLVVLSLVGSAIGCCCDGRGAECSKEDTFYYFFETAYERHYLFSSTHYLSEVKSSCCYFCWLDSLHDMEGSSFIGSHADISFAMANENI